MGHIITTPDVIGPEESVRLFHTLINPAGGVAELRLFAPTYNGRLVTMAGYYDDPERFVADAVQATERGPGKHHPAAGVFATINPPIPDLLARSANRLSEAQKGGTTKNEEIVRRQLLGLDVDPVRPSGISASDAEKEAAFAVARNTFLFLRKQGWTDPVAIDSGNGLHLYYPIDLPADDGGLVSNCLKALGARFSTEAAHIDTAVANAARIMKVPGTWARKGDDTAERPHRVAVFRSVPDWVPAPPEERPVVSEDALRALAAEVQETPTEVRRTSVAVAKDVLKTTPDDPLKVRAALTAIAEKGRLEYAEWAKLAAATRAACGGDVELAERLLTETIGEEADGEYARVLSSGWDKIRAGTLYHMAKQSGWAGTADHSRTSPHAILGPISTCVADVEPEEVNWMWEGWLVAGKAHILDGDPGVGKSTIYASLAACVTAGVLWPDGTAVAESARGGVVIVTAEDDIASTIRPRLEAAGADISRVGVIGMLPTADGSGRLPGFPDDVALLIEECQRVDAKLLIIDPVTAYLGGTNSYKDSDVRAALTPLAAAAEKAGIAVLFLRHLNKSEGGPALYRGGGSIAFVGLVRIALLVGAVPNDPTGDSRALAVAKNNLSRFPQAIGYHIESAPPHNVGCIVWDGPVPYSADDLVRPDPKGSGAPALDAAVDFLTTALGTGPRLASELYDEAEAAGLSTKTLRRAKKEMGVVVVKSGFGDAGAWTWSMPGSTPSPGGDGAAGAPAVGPSMPPAPATPRRNILGEQDFTLPF